MNVNSEKVVLGLGISGRFTEGLPLVLVAVDLRGGGDRKLRLAKVNWPPPFVEMTPTVSATILKEGFEELGFKQLNASDCRIFTDGPIACSDSGVRKANLELPDVDWTRVPLIREAIVKDDNSRTSLEFFHSLLWQERFSDDVQLEEWRLGFQVKDNSSKSPNIFEVCLGQRARELMLQKRRGSKPHSKDSLEWLKDRLRKFEIDCSSIEVPKKWETDAFIRALMLLIIGLEYGPEHNKSRWRSYGEPIVFTDGLMSEGEVLGIACAKFGHDSAKKIHESIQCKYKKLYPSEQKKGKFPTERLWVYFANNPSQSHVKVSKGKDALRLPTIYTEWLATNDVIFIASKSADNSSSSFVKSWCLVGKSRKKSNDPCFVHWDVKRRRQPAKGEFQITADMPELVLLEQIRHGFPNPAQKIILSGDESGSKPLPPSTSSSQLGNESQWDVDLAAADYVCVLDRENLRSVLKEEFLPTAGLRSWRHSPATNGDNSKAEILESLQAGQAVLLVSYSGWKPAEQKVKFSKKGKRGRQMRSEGAPASIFPVAFVRIGKNSKKPKAGGSGDKRFTALSENRAESFKWQNKKGKVEYLGVNVRFEGLAKGRQQVFPPAILEKGPFLGTDEFRKVVNPHE